MPTEKMSLTPEEAAVIYSAKFVNILTTKLLFFHSILNGDEVKNSKITLALKGEGEAYGGLLGSVLDLGGIAIPEGLLQNLSKSIGFILGSIEGAYYKDKVSNYSEFIHSLLKNGDDFVRNIAEASINIFCDYELQLTNVTGKGGPRYALQDAAKDGVERFFKSSLKDKGISIELGVLLGKSKRKLHFINWRPKKGSYKVKFAFNSSSATCVTNDLYANPGMLKGTNGKHVFYVLKEGSCADTFGYRLVFSDDKDWNEIESRYEEDVEAETRNAAFAKFKYYLNSKKKRKELLEEVMKALKEEEGTLREEELLNTLTETKEVISKNFEDMQKKLNEITKNTKETAEGVKETISKLADVQDNLKKLDSMEGYLSQFNKGLHFIKAQLNQVANGVEDIKQTLNNQETKDEQRHNETKEYLETIKMDVKNLATVVSTDTLDSPDELWFQVPQSLTKFTGRESKVEEVHTSLSSNIGEKRLKKQKPVVMCGLSGIGKTETAIFYATKYSTEYNNNVIWIHAENENTICQSFRKFANLRFPNTSASTLEYPEEDLSLVIQETYKILNNYNCLFIYDNLEGYQNYKIIVPNLPEGYTYPRILVTSQDGDWFEECNVIPIEKLTEKEATEFLKISIKAEQNEQDLRDLSKLLGCFPLALKQAAAVINEESRKAIIQRISFGVKDYIKIFKEDTKFLLEKELPDKCEKTTFVALNITLSKVKDESCGKAYELLEIISYFNPDNIQFDLLKNLDSVWESVLTLQQYSIITGGEDGMPYTIHRLIQRVVQINLKEKHLEEKVLYKTTKLLYDQIQSKEESTEWEYEKIMHLSLVWKAATRFKSIVKDFSKMAISIQSALQNQGKIREIVELSRVTTNAWKNYKIYPDIISELTPHFLQFGAMYPSVTTVKKIEFALELQKEILSDISKGERTDNSEDTCQEDVEFCLQIITELLKNIKESEKVVNEELIKSCIELVERCRGKWGDVHSLTIYAMIIKADALRRLTILRKKNLVKLKKGSPDYVTPNRLHNATLSSAISTYRELYETTKKNLGYENVFTYDAMINWASLVKDQDKSQEVKIYQEYSDHCKPSHMHAIFTNMKIAQLQQSQDPSKSIKIYETLLMNPNELGMNNYFEAKSRKAGLLPKVYKEDGLNQALLIYKDLLDDRNRYTEKQVIKIREEMTNVYELKGNKEMAANEQKEILKIKNQSSNYDGKKVFATIKRIESILKAEEKHNDMIIQLHREQLTIAKDDHLTMELLRNLATFYESLKKNKKAKGTYILLHTKEKEVYGIENASLSTLDKVQNLSDNDNEDSLRLHETFLQECIKNLSYDHQKTQVVMKKLAVISETTQN